MDRHSYPLGPADAMKWAQQYEASRTYLKKINANREKSAQRIYLYCKWANLNPDELIALKANRDPAHYDDAEKLLDRFVSDYTDLPESGIRNTSITIKGLYSRNRRRLEQAGDVEYVPKKSQKKPSREERFLLYQACYNPRDKALVTVPCCSGIALETLTHLRWDMFESDWMRQETPHISIDGAYLKGHGRGKYRGVRQETFVTPECKKLLIEYRDWYSKTFNYIWRNDNPVFLDIRKDKGKRLEYAGVLSVMSKIVERSGVRFGVHDGRRVLNTALQDVECDPNWIQMAMGRKVPGNKDPYTKPNIEQLRAKYQKALGELEFLGTGFKSDKDEFTVEEKLLIKQLLADELKRRRQTN